MAQDGFRTSGMSCTSLRPVSIPGCSGRSTWSLPAPPLARGDRQHHPGAHGRPDPDRRARGGLVPVQRRDQARHRLHARRCSTRWRRWTGRSCSMPGAETICWANVQLMPDPTILSMETGTRHRTAERVSKQTKRARDLDLRAPRRRLPLRRGDEVHPPGHPHGALEGEPGAGDAGEVPRPARPGLGPPHQPRVPRRLHASRRPLRDPARRVRDQDGRRGGAIHHRAGHRGPPDRDAARGDAWSA